MGLVHAIKKSHLQIQMILENALGRQLVLECKGISGVRSQSISTFANPRECTVKKMLVHMGSIHVSCSTITIGDGGTESRAVAIPMVRVAV